MRKSNNRGSYRGSPRGRGGVNRNTQPGPNKTSEPITSKIRDIDMELQILKRKREMLQQEQELLDKEREYKRMYKQSPNFGSQKKQKGSTNSNNFDSPKSSRDKNQSNQRSIENEPTSGGQNALANLSRQQRKRKSKRDVFEDEESLTLRPHVKPSDQVTGRLELALGQILAGIKNKHVNSVHSKVVKQVIRDRIRSVMMNKTVICSKDVLTEYREVYPEPTDKELASLGQLAHKYSFINMPELSVAEAEDVDKYYIDNYWELMGMELTKMFSQVDSLYAVDDDALVKLMKDLNEIDNKKDEAVSIGSETLGNLDKTLAKAKIYSQMTETIIEKQMPLMLPKFHNVLLSILNESNENSEETLKIRFEAIKRAILEVSQNEGLSSKVAKLTNIIEENEPDEDKDMEVEVIEVERTAEDKKCDESEVVKETIAEEQEKTQDKLCEVNNGSTNNNLQLDGQYHIKVIGRPKLPSRAACYEFLQKFKPTSIKKHKTIANLLIIAFNNNDGFENILLEDNVIIEGCTLVIKSGESQTPQTQPPKTSEDFEANNENTDEAVKDSNTESEKEKADKSNIGDAITHSVSVETTDTEDKSVTEEGDAVTVSTDTEDKSVTEEKELKTQNDKVEIDVNAAQGEIVNIEIIPEADENNDDNATKSVKDNSRATRARTASGIVGTPGTVRTRRASRLAQNNN